jgi:hypothetical protein
VRFARVVTWLGLLSLASQLVAVLAGAVLDPTWTILSGALVVGSSWVRAIEPGAEAGRDRLASTVEVWLADERPAWETIEAFERDVECVMRGEQTEDYGGIPAAQSTKRCRHRWTTIPPRHVDAMRALGHRLPDAYVGAIVTPWCVKCRTKKNGGRVTDLESLARKIESGDDGRSSVRRTSQGTVYKT